MSTKISLVLCALAFFVQSSVSQCFGRAAIADIGPKCPLGYTWDTPGMAGLKCPYGYGDSLGLDGAYGLGAPWGLDGAYGFGAPCGWAGPAIDFSPTSGGGLPVSSASAIAPVGLAVASENVYEGRLAAGGELPFVGTVGVEGTMPTVGAGAVNHHCGDGINAMVSDGIGYAGAYGLGYDSICGRDYAGAYGLGLGASRLGCRAKLPGKRCGCGVY